MSRPLIDVVADAIHSVPPRRSTMQEAQSAIDAVTNWLDEQNPGNASWGDAVEALGKEVDRG